MAYQYLWDFIPDAQTALDIEPAELGLAVLRVLNTRHNDKQFHPYNFRSDLDTQRCPYPIDKRPLLVEALMEAWSWLLTQNLLAPTGDASSTTHAFITRRGRKIISDQDAIDYKKAAALPFQLLHPQIAAATRGPFLRGEYDTAVFVSFRTVEEVVRTAGSFKATDMGPPLMRKAFQVEDMNASPPKPPGPLTDPNAVAAEQQALSDLAAGAMGSYKNPHSHRTVGLCEPMRSVSISSRCRADRPGKGTVEHSMWSRNQTACR
jgi:uncharacterized protein (TIGR02391 family)